MSLRQFEGQQGTLSPGMCKSALRYKVSVLHLCYWARSITLFSDAGWPYIHLPRP